ncbi:MAG: alginate export family protein, partial [Planctomycetia bacterium]
MAATTKFRKLRPMTTAAVAMFSAAVAAADPAAVEPTPVAPAAVGTTLSETIVSPDAPAMGPCAETGACLECKAPFDFKKVPPVRSAPRTGNFSILPTGPGYYSFADFITGNERKKPPKYGYNRFALLGPSFFDSDFRYLDDPKNVDHDYADPLKRIRLGDDWLLSTGGTIWSRSFGEYNSRLTTNDNNYNLTRIRSYADLWYQDRFRIFGEFIGSWTLHQDLPPLLIDQTNADILNLFVDVKLFECDGDPVYLRAGRQELLIGSQRLLSNLDWANTRRTFQGVRALKSGEKWDADLFWVQPVIPEANDLDDNDQNQNFAGAWLTYKPMKGVCWELYDLVLDNQNATTQTGIVRNPSTINTLGGRFSGDKNNFLWDFEGAMQLGARDDQDVVAGMATTGVGYNFKDAPMNPSVWLYYD